MSRNTLSKPQPDSASYVSLVKAVKKKEKNQEKEFFRFNVNNERKE